MPGWGLERRLVFHSLRNLLNARHYQGKAPALAQTGEEWSNLGVEMHTCSPSTQEAETGESRVPGHPGSIGSSSLTWAPRERGYNWGRAWNRDLIGKANQGSVSSLALGTRVIRLGLSVGVILTVQYRTPGSAGEENTTSHVRVR